MNEPDPEITGLFVQESSEHLQRLERELLDLEDHPDDADLLASVFRSVHTIKGTSGFLGFTHLEALTHAGEEVLSHLRAGRLRLTPEVMTPLLAMIDDVRSTVGRIERTGAEGIADHGQTINRLRRLLPEAARTATDTEGPSAEPVQPAPPEQPDDAPAPTDSEPAGDAGAHDAQAGTDADPVTPEPQRAPVGEEAVPVRTGSDNEGSAVGSDTSVRLAVDVLDRIMDLTGELVVLRSRLGAVVGEDDATSVTAIHRDLRQVTAGLQAEVMRSRLQPVEVVLGRLRRIARDLAQSLGRQVHVEITGEEIAVDRAINDALRDPLLHMVRNAVDHGLEPPAERVAAGKDPTGRLTITASHARGRVRIDVCDDGRGLDLPALRRHAVAAGRLSHDEAEALSDREAAELALEAGISTSSQVTKLSGRGVGLDVVRSVLATIGGRVDISSDPGRGTCFSVNVPLSLAMLPVLTVTSDGHTYCIPQANVLEVRGVAGEESAITAVEDVPIYRLRGHLLPLVSLTGTLSAADGTGDVLAGATRVVIVESDERRFALAVASAGDTLDVVVKPMPRECRGIGVFMGVSILADGQPSLILDLAGVADVAAVTSRAEMPMTADLPSTPAGEAAIVLAEIDGGGAVAVRLADVVRLERFELARVKRRGEGDAVMYGDEIVPLLRVAEVLPERRRARRGGRVEPETGSVAAIVCRVGDRLVGLVVSHIIDVVPEPPAPAQPASRPGVVSTLYLHEQFAEVLDLPQLVDRASIGSVP